MYKPWAYVSSAWDEDSRKAKKIAKKYCRQLYNAGYTPICPLISFADLLDDEKADEHRDYLDMSEELLRRSRILVVCGTVVDETVKNDVGVANRYFIASSTLEGVLSVDKTRKG